MAESPAALRFLRVDHVELAVSDVDRAAEVHHRLGFVPFGTREIRERRLKSYRLVSGPLSVLLTQSRLKTDPVAVAVEKHGDGVFSVGFLCQDAISALEALHRRGAQVVKAPRTVQIGEPAVTQTQAQVLAFEHVRHTLVARNGGPFLEGFTPMPGTPPGGFGIERVAGWTAFVEPEMLRPTAERYAALLGLEARESPDPHALAFATADGTLALRVERPAAEHDRAHDFLGVNHGAGIGEVVLVATNVEAARDKVRAAGLEVDRETGLTAPIAGMLRYRIVGA